MLVFAKSILLPVLLVAVSQTSGKCMDWRLWSYQCAVLFEHKECRGLSAEAKLGVTKVMSVGWNNL